MGGGGGKHAQSMGSVQNTHTEGKLTEIPFPGSSIIKAHTLQP